MPGRSVMTTFTSPRPPDRACCRAGRAPLGDDLARVFTEPLLNCPTAVQLMTEGTRPPQLTYGCASRHRLDGPCRGRAGNPQAAQVQGHRDCCACQSRFNVLSSLALRGGVTQ